MCEKFKGCLFSVIYFRLSIFGYNHYRNLYFLSGDQKCQKVGLNLRLNRTNKLYSTFHECEKFSPTNDRSSNGITPRPVWHTAPAMASFAMRISPETDSRLTKPPYVMIPITIRIVSTGTTTTTRLMTTPRRTESKTSPTTTTKRTTTTTTPTTTTTRTIPTTKRPITLEEANNLAYQCCISSGISTKCAATLCRYNAKPDDVMEQKAESLTNRVLKCLRTAINYEPISETTLNEIIA
uniref:Uncharacterized protein n=1 Tax=Romanomermis culicivorax TaxID=13658 RepID=A0A915JSW9_ROMCU